MEKEKTSSHRRVRDDATQVLEEGDLQELDPGGLEAVDRGWFPAAESKPQVRGDEPTATDVSRADTVVGGASDAARVAAAAVAAVESAASEAAAEAKAPPRDEARTPPRDEARTRRASRPDHLPASRPVPSRSAPPASRALLRPRRARPPR